MLSFWLRGYQANNMMIWAMVDGDDWRYSLTGPFSAQEQAARLHARAERLAVEGWERKRTAPCRPSYAERIRRGEHEGRGKAPGARYSAEDLRAMREQALALTHLGATGWLPESEGQQPALFEPVPLEGGKEG